MNFWQKFCLSVVLVSFALVSSSAVAQTDRSSDGGKREFDYSVGTFGRDHLKAEIREFVWTRWSSESKGKIKAVHYNMHGNAKVTEFRIKKDRNSKWFVELLVYRKHGLWNLSKTLFERVRYYDISRVEAISFADSAEVPTPIKSDTVRKPSTYRVRLRSASPAEEFIF